MKKTIVNWFTTMPSPLCEEALDNVFSMSIFDLVESLAEAIDKGFTWSNSPQGQPYWSDVYQRAKRGEFDSKTAEEWLKHFPVDIRENVIKERMKNFKFVPSNVERDVTYESLSDMLLSSIGDDMFLEKQQNPQYWRGVLKRIEAGEFDQPWVEPKAEEEPQPFEVGDEVELFWVRGTVITREYYRIIVLWTDGRKNAFQKGSNIYNALHKVTPKEPTVYEKYPIGSKWTVELELEVLKHDTRDSRMPIQFRNTFGDNYMWFSAAQLPHFKPQKD